MSQNEGAGVGAPDYNDIFERLVETDEGGEINALEGFVAYGFYKVAKREWAMKIREDHKRGPNPEELKAYIAKWTDSRISGLFDSAQETLASYAGDVIEDETPAIKDAALQEKVAGALDEFRKGSKITVGSAFVSFIMSMLGAACWTALLFLIFLCFQAAGVDVLNIAGSASKHAG